PKLNNMPVTMVSWEDANEFCQNLKLPSGLVAGLPTEAEWEYACRAGSTSVFSFGNASNGKDANCNGHSPYGSEVKGPWLGIATVVGSYAPNHWGLHDMHGNVREWCEDWYEDSLTGGRNPVGPVSGTFRVMRGGSWYIGPQDDRSGFRNKRGPTTRVPTLG